MEGTPQAEVSGTCSLGEAGVPENCWCGGLSSYQEVHVRLPASDCPACQSSRLTTAHVWLGFWGAYSSPVSVRVVAAHRTACPGPDEATELCPPLEYVLSAPAAGLYEFALPLPAGCCVEGDAFLELTLGNVAGGHDLVTTPTVGASACSSNTYVDGTPLLNWICPAVPCTCSWGPSCSSGQGIDAVMSVDAVCCEPTAIEPSSWGRSKALYR